MTTPASHRTTNRVHVGPTLFWQFDAMREGDEIRAGEELHRVLTCEPYENGYLITTELVRREASA